MYSKRAGRERTVSEEPKADSQGIRNEIPKVPSHYIKGNNRKEGDT